MDSRKLVSFRKTVWKHYRAHGRNDLPWRKTTNPYRILVSEVMLQQTQVSRVLEKYKEFLKEFPTVQVLAMAPLSNVLRVWSGLGYNRRAKYLHDAAKEVVTTHQGNIKKALEHPLSGVGPYTRAAVRTFAFNEPHPMIETNIRTAFIHHFHRESFSVDSAVTDSELLLLIGKAGAGQEPREWYWALMDYGSHLKQSGVKNNARSKSYTKQSAFKGSLREVRGAILRELHKGPSSVNKLPFDKKKVKKAIATLVRDGLIEEDNSIYRIC